MSRQIRKDDPHLEIDDHARRVVVGAAKLDAEDRAEMIAVLGPPDDDVDDKRICIHWLAYRGR